MANVLATLFSDIANAIRNKTGLIGKITPKDFPVYINSIKVGGGENGDEPKQWKFASGEVTPTGGALTINHGLGVVPDIIYVQNDKRSADDKGVFVSAMQFSTAFTEAMNGNGADTTRGVGYGVLANGWLGVLQNKEGVEGSHSQFADMYGNIRNANPISFTVGGGEFLAIRSDGKVTWWAVSGIT